MSQLGILLRYVSTGVSIHVLYVTRRSLRRQSLKERYVLVTVLAVEKVDILHIITNGMRGDWPRSGRKEEKPMKRFIILVIVASCILWWATGKAVDRINSQQNRDLVVRHIDRHLVEK
jgi:hypothetical protein